MTGPGQDEDQYWPGVVYDCTTVYVPIEVAKEILPQPKFHHYIADVIPIHQNRESISERTA